jgi:putative heme-binding domain-containing protein
VEDDRPTGPDAICKNAPARGYIHEMNGERGRTMLTSFFSNTVRVRTVPVLAAGLLAAAASGVAMAEPRTATPPASITVPPGFRVELLRSAQDGEDSWISMSFDPQGRIVVGLDQRGVARLSPRGDAWDFERLDDTLRHCRGVLCAHDAIYVNATDTMEFWRFRDPAGDGRFADRTLLKSFDYRSRYGHGQNQIVLGPDRMLYLIVGDDVSFPAGTSPASPYRSPHVDRLLPDPHDVGRDERVGYILRTDPDGREWTVLAGGLRNQFDAAFSPTGELFTWDADMEWDVGQPWYRPTRLIHVASGGEYGWRWGTAPWPSSYPDSLPATLETGLASPTALAFGTTSRFPEPFRSGLFMADWQHGRILVVTLSPSGASYTATDAVFAEGAPLNVCDMEFGPDGALYFLTGGRGSQSGLYRITATATASTPTAAVDATAAAARARRRALERYHTGPAAGAVEDLWPDLGSDDRWLRNAARVALERQPLDSWRERARAETDPLRRGEAILAWVRVAEPAERGDVVRAMLAGPAGSDESVVLLGLRTLAIALVRGVDLGADATAVHAHLAALDGHPAATVQRELVELLVATRAPAAVAAVLRRLDRAAGQEEQIHCVHALVRWDGPWTAAERRRLLRWFVDARAFTGGHLLPKIVARMQDDFTAGLCAEERSLLAPELAALEAPPAASPADQPAEAPRPVVRHWAVADLAPHLDAIDHVRDPARARRALAVGQCLKCHKLGGGGSAVGPDLSAVGRRFDLRAIAESIIEPSKVVDPKYHATTFVLASGRVVTGRSAGVSSQEIQVETDALRGRTEKIARADIEATHPSTVSPMPQGLLDTLSLDEVLDLLAVVRSGGLPAGD